MIVWLSILTSFFLVLSLVLAFVLKWLWEDTKKVCVNIENLEEQIDVIQKQALQNSEIFYEFFQATADIVEIQAAALQRLTQPNNDLN